MNRFILTIFLLFPFVQCENILGQNNQQLYFLPESGAFPLARSSAFPDNKLQIGIPGLSGTLASISNNGFDYRMFHQKDANGNIVLHFDELMDDLMPKNTLESYIQADIISAGYRSGKNYFSFNYSNRTILHFIYTEELIELIYNGNAAYLGQTIDLSDCGLNGVNFMELGIGFTRQINEKWIAGIRLKRLTGFENISADFNNLSVYTDPTDYTLELLANTTINTSSGANAEDGFETYFGEDGSESPSDYFWGRENIGWALNAGVSFRMNDQWTFSADASDIGSIRWKSDTKNYRLEAGYYSYSGIDLDEFIETDADSIDILDSLAAAFEPEETFDPYTSPLPAQITLAAEQKINDKTTIGYSMRGIIFDRQLLPSVGVNLKKSVGKNLTLTANYSWNHKRFDNLGLGMVLRAGAFNFFILTDNIIGTIYPLTKSATHLHAGLNLCWPLNKEKD